MSNPVVQWQFLTQAPDAHAAFYADLFDWRIDADNPLGYRRVDTGSEEGIGGGFWPAPPEAPNFVQLFVAVDDVAASVERASGLGAKVLVPPQELPDGGEMAVLLDPQGVSFAVCRR